MNDELRSGGRAWSPLDIEVPRHTLVGALAALVKYGPATQTTEEILLALQPIADGPASRRDPDADWVMAPYRPLKVLIDTVEDFEPFPTAALQALKAIITSRSRSD